MAIVLAVIAVLVFTHLSTDMMWPPATGRVARIMMPDDGPYPRAMARVDPGDDSIQRFIVRHYRYDPERRERRHVVVAAFDNEPEFRACMMGVAAEIRRRRDAGEPVDLGEHASGIVHEPGYLRRAANGHLLSRAIRHGATGRWMEDLELPTNMSVMRAERPQPLSQGEVQRIGRMPGSRDRASLQRPPSGGQEIHWSRRRITLALPVRWRAFGLCSVRYLFEVAFPAQRYVRRRGEQRRREFMQQHGRSKPRLVTAEPDAARSTGPESDNGRMRAVRDQLLEARDRVLAGQSELVRRAATELDRTRTTEIRTSAGTVRARVTRFRWGPDVLEISHVRLSDGGGGSSSLLPRRAGQDRTDELMSRLAYHLARVEAKAPPPTA